MPPSRPTLSRRAFGGLLGAGAAATGLSAAVPSTAQARPFRAATDRQSDRPNILFVFADDLGWADLSCYGSPYISTPNLDRLAAQGIRFTDAYSGSSTCSPTRISLYTGRYPGRIEAGIHEPLMAADAGLDPSHPTLASLLRSGGYTTSMIGKWHCGRLPRFSPTRSGWTEFFGNFEGVLEYYSKLDPFGRYDLYEGETPYQDLRYYTRIITERAVEFVERDHEGPWLLNLNFTTPHSPWIADGDIEEAARLERGIRELPPEEGALMLIHLDGGSTEKYRQMVEDLDQSIGKVMAALHRSGGAENTLVIFSSDNGGERFSYSWPFTGAKHTLLEGGIRVPTIARWPARLDPGQVSDLPVMTPDWTATMLEVGEVTADPAVPLDGTGLAGYLLRGEPAPARDLFWRSRHERALRRGKWKYYRTDGPSNRLMDRLYTETGRGVLYDLSTDPTECADRSRHEPELMADLLASWERIAAGLLAYPAEDPSPITSGS